MHQHEWVRGRCPICEVTAWRQVQDLGFGLLIICLGCDWCWDVDGDSSSRDAGRRVTDVVPGLPADPTPSPADLYTRLSTPVDK